MAAGHRHSPTPSTQRRDEINVSTIAVPTDWLADPPASSETLGRLALTDAALNHLVNALAGQRDGDLPEDLSPSGMATLLDAEWVKEQPWRDWSSAACKTVEDRTQRSRDTCLRCRTSGTAPGIAGTATTWADTPTARSPTR